MRDSVTAHPSGGACGRFDLRRDSGTVVGAGLLDANAATRSCSLCACSDHGAAAECVGVRGANGHVLYGSNRRWAARISVAPTWQGHSPGADSAGRQRRQRISRSQPMTATTFSATIFLRTTLSAQLTSTPGYVLTASGTCRRTVTGGPFRRRAATDWRWGWRGFVAVLAIVDCSRTLLLARASALWIARDSYAELLRQALRLERLPRDSVAHIV